MLSRWRIKKKLIASAFTLACVIGILAFSGLRGVYAYRGLARGISGRARELPLTAELSRYTVELSALVHQLHHGEHFPAANVCQESVATGAASALFRDYLPSDRRDAQYLQTRAERKQSGQPRWLRDWDNSAKNGPNCARLTRRWPTSGRSSTMTERWCWMKRIWNRFERSCGSW